LSGFAAALSIDFAIKNNARIINFPWYSQSEENFELVAEALDDANLNDVIVFAPTGDDWNELCSEVWWPAKREDIIAVGATDKNDNRAVWWGQIGSRYGDETEISLPGRYVLVRDIYWEGSPGHPPGYYEISSTSIATSLASGIGALMLAVNPCLKQQDVRALLIESCVKTGGYNYNHDPEKPGHSLELGYGLVDTYEAVKAAVNYPVDQFITQNEVWSGYQVKGNIIVKSGTTLTLNNVDLEMYSGKKIIIEPEAKLYVNGGTITNYCNGPWQGIEVWGDYTAHQFPDGNGNYLQGVLVLNGAIIENAISAVELWKPQYYTKTGGIIFANDAIFRNNAKSVHALYYDNYNPINETTVNYNSYFHNCTFEISADYHGEVTFYKHVDLCNVKGLKFEGCDFSLDAAADNISFYNKAIAAYDAGFSVIAFCTSQTIPCSSYDRCTFDGFYDAVYASGGGTSNTFYVNRAIFTNNTSGISVNSVNNFSVLFSDFYIGHNATDQDDCDGIGMTASGYGINANASTGFAIEENKFYKAAGAPQGYYTGILIAESQSTNQVYRNTFEGLNYGNYAVGKNYRQPNYFFQGLAYFCNENTGNFADFFVEPDNDPEKISGIQSKQGDDNFVTGNKFTSAGNTWHFFNGGDYLVGYYYCNYCDDESPDESKIFQITDKPKSFSNNCPSHYGGGGSTEKSIVLTTSEKQEAEMEFAVNLSNYNNVKTLYDNLKDGGNTDAVIADIENSWPTDMWELRAQLLGKSPHLSMEVLKAAADKTDVLPESIIFEVMEANPDELKKEELIRYLEDKAEPLPEYMINILRHVAQGTTYKTVLEQHMAHYNQVKTRAAYDIVRSLLNDTISDPEQLRNWLDNVGGKRADEQIIATYLSESNYTNALSLANMMPSLYAYSGTELTEHGYYMDMLDLQINLEQQQRTIFDLDSLEVANLLNIAENSQGTAGLQAKGILEYAHGYNFCNCLNISDMSGFKQSAIINTDDLAKLHGVDINIHPNPASQWVAFNYALPANATQGEIKITDAKGAMITSYTVTGSRGQQVWDTRSHKSGVYFYTLSVGEFTKSGKIVINK
jgi:hypothetical protein